MKKKIRRRKSAGRRHSTGRRKTRRSLGLGGMVAKARSLKGNLKRFLRKSSGGGGDTYRITAAIDQIEAVEQSLKLAKAKL